jgi:hypothetical protein
LMRLLEQEAREDHGTHFGDELVGALPQREFVHLGPRILALYQGRTGVTGSEHWLWSSFALIGRLGDLGSAASSVLASTNNRDIFYGHGSVEGLCRLGSSGRAAAEPVLTRAWARDPGGNSLLNLAIATRRIGIVQPQVSSFRQQRDAAVFAEAAKVTPASPPSVCTLATDYLEAEERNKHAIGRAEFYQRNRQGK